MADTQHSALTGASLHEPKGADAAANNTIYTSNGAGSGTWQKVANVSMNGITGNGTADQILVADGSGGFDFVSVPHGTVYFFNASTPSAVTYPSTYTKVAPTTTAGGMPTEFTEATTARLTYTGTASRHFHIAADLSVDQTTGANRDIQFAIYKNGSVIANSEKISTLSSGLKRSVALHSDVMLSTNDYLEVYVQNNGASGDVNVYQLYMFAMGMVGDG